MIRDLGLPPACVHGTWNPLLSEVVVKFALEGCHVYQVSDYFGETVEDFWSLASYGLFSCFLKVGWGSGKIENSACSSSVWGISVCFWMHLLGSLLRLGVSSSRIFQMWIARYLALLSSRVYSWSCWHPLFSLLKNQHQ